VFKYSTHISHLEELEILEMDVSKEFLDSEVFLIKKQ